MCEFECEMLIFWPFYGPLNMFESFLLENVHVLSSDFPHILKIAELVIFLQVILWICIL